MRECACNDHRQNYNVVLWFLIHQCPKLLLTHWSPGKTLPLMTVNDFFINGCSYFGKLIMCLVIVGISIFLLSPTRRNHQVTRPLALLFWGRYFSEKYIDSMAADDLAPGIARPSAAMLLTVWDMTVIVFNKEIFQRPKTSVFPEIIANANKSLCFLINNYDVIKCKHFQRYCPFVRGIHRLPVDSPHTGTVTRTFDVSVLLVWTKCWGNTRLTGNSRHHDGHLTP